MSQAPPARGAGAAEIPGRCPCIGVCSTSLLDKVCRGCKRFDDEVSFWPHYSLPQRLAVLRRIESFAERCLADDLQILDPQAMQGVMDRLGLRSHQDASPWWRAWMLLYRIGGRLDKVPDCGLAWRGDLDGKRMAQRFADLDKRMLELSHHYLQRRVRGDD